MSSDEEYKPTGDIESIWNQTSKWRPIQLEILKVKFANGNVVNIEDLSSVQLDPDVDRILLTGIDIRTTTSVPKMQRAFFNRLVQLSTFSDEPPVDSVAHDLLTYTGYEDEVLHFRPKPHLEMVWQGHDITSEADYGVYSERSRGTTSTEYLVVVEDKPEKRRSYQGGECQLYGEMFLAGFNRYLQRKQDQIVYGMILRGPFVRLYKTVFEKRYFENIEHDKIPSVKISPKRFPPDTDFPLSLNDAEQREKIVRLLSVIRKEVEIIAQQY